MHKSIYHEYLAGNVYTVTSTPADNSLHSAKQTLASHKQSELEIKKRIETTKCDFSDKNTQLQKIIQQHKVSLGGVCVCLYICVFACVYIIVYTSIYPI